MRTPSRTHLKHIPTGLSKALEFAVTPSELVLVLNKKYSANYKYDVARGTFQLGAINLQFKRIEELDFDLLEEYSDVATASQVLKGYELLIVQENKINIFAHYDGVKTVNTPKLKSVVNTYARFGLYENKAKIAIAYKQGA